MELYHGDCLELMKYIPDKSVDMILCDLPYGTTACKWDTVIPFDKLWEKYKRVIASNGAIVLFCQQPFTSNLIVSNIDMFKYMWYWRKSRPSGFTNAKLKPLKNIEEIAVFSFGKTANGSSQNMVYNPQGLEKVDKLFYRKSIRKISEVSPTRKNTKLNRIIEYGNYPRQILDYSMHNVGQIHPTQKPVSLMEYLIKTYTNECDTVLDNCMGSGTTGVACINTNRKFIGIEMDANYFEIAKDRINNHPHGINRGV